MKSVWKQNVCMLWFSQLLVFAGYDAMNPFVPLLLKDGLQLTEPATLAFFISLYNICSFVGYAISNPLWGYLGDRYGMKVMLLRGTFLTALFWPVMGYVTSPWTLVILRFVTAFLAGTTAASQMMIARTAPWERQGLAQGILTTAIWGGSILGNTLGGYIISRYNFTYAFCTCGILYFIAGFSIFFTHDDGTQTTEVKCNHVTKKHWSFSSVLAAFKLSKTVWCLLALFVLSLGVRRIEQPYIALRIADIVPKDQAASFTGIVSAINGVGAILSGVVFGYIIDKVPPRKLLLPLCLSCAALMYWQAVTSSVVQLATSRTLYFFVIGALHPMLQKLLTLVTPHEKRGLAFGFSSTASGIGGIIASVIGGVIYGHSGTSAVFVITAIALVIVYPILDYGIKVALRYKESPG